MPPEPVGPLPAVPVRRLARADLDQVQTLVTQCPEAAQWSLQNLQQLFSPADCAWVVELAGTNSICAFLSARIVSDQAEILNLAVAPGRRRLGHASSLFREALMEFRRRKASSIFLEVRESNSAAIRFYERMLFVKSGIRPSYYRHPEEAAVVMVRKFTD
jgi:ribosomal-protein-alanine N-acetyltransferase